MIKTRIRIVVSEGVAALTARLRSVALTGSPLARI